MASEAPVVTDETKLRRFLHYASVEGTYFPGSRLHTTHLREENVDMLRAVLENMPKEKIFDIIKKIHKENSSPHPEMIPFVLAECTRIETLKADVFTIAELLCDDTKLFMLFFKFGLERMPRMSTAKRCKRLIAAYYLKKDVIKLAGEVSQYPAYRGWRHSDLMRIGHVKAEPEDIARQAVFSYINRGTGTMNTNYGKKSEAKVIVDHLNKVEIFRKEKDPAKVVETIETYMLTLDHLNHHLLKDKQVWTALLRRIPLKTLLQNLNFIARNKLFRNGRAWDTDFTTFIRDSMQNNQAIKDSGLHPSRVFLEYINYQRAARFKLGSAVEKCGKAVQKAPSVSPDILHGLNQLTNATFKFFKPTNLRYIIAVDPLNMNTRKCGHIPWMLPSQGAAITIQTYLKIEPNVTVVCPTFEGPIQPIDVPKTSTTKELEDILSNLLLKIPVPAETTPKRDPTTAMHGVFEWAHKQKKEFDVFILVSTAINACSHAAKFNAYQRAMKLPQCKLVLLSLCCTKNTVDMKDVFVVSGFDDKVLPLVANFVKEVV